MSVSMSDVRGLEERAFNAWPALQTVLMDGWLLRFADGYTKRANSVNAWAPTRHVGDVITLAGPLYARLGLPLIFRLSPLAGGDSDRLLADAGFVRADESLVLTSPLATRECGDPDITLASEADPAWLDGFAGASGVPPARRGTHDRLLAAIRLPAAFACLRDNGVPIAWGLAVAERGRIGLFDIVTDPGARRRGAARRLVTALLAWGAELGATGAYLQVTASNAAAIRLYESLGFREVYRYHYRIAAE